MGGLPSDVILINRVFALLSHRGGKVTGVDIADEYDTGV